MHPEFFFAAPKQPGPVHQFLEHNMHLSAGASTTVISVIFVLILLAAITAGLKKVFS